MITYNKNLVEVASNCGATLSKYILTVERTTVDLKWEEKKQGGMQRPALPFYRYSIKPTRVTGVNINESANEIPFVYFNGDTNLRLNLADVSKMEAVIPKANTESVKNAIAEFEATGKKPIFTDYVGLIKEVTALNNESKTLIDSFINDLMKQSRSLEESNETEITACKVAMKECGVDVTGLLP